MIQIRVKGHPNTNHRPRRRGAQYYMDSGYLDWRNAITSSATWQVDVTTKQDIILAVYAMTKGFRKQDVDNLAKAPLEALEGVLYFDDNQVVNLHVFKSVAKQEEFMIIRAWTVHEVATNYNTFYEQLFDFSFLEGKESWTRI